MPTVTLRPSGNGSLNQHTAVGAASAYLCVNESSPDDDTTYIKTPAGGFGTRDNVFAFDYAGSLDGENTINSITVHMRARRVNGDASDDITFNLRQGIFNQIGGTTDPTASYADYSHEFNSGNVANFPATAQELIDGDYELGVRSVSSNLGDDDIRITQVWIVIDYNPVASDEREIHTLGSATATGERGILAAGGDGRYIEPFSNTTFRDTGNTDAKWDGDGVLEMGP